jgi:succinyl-CoA:acetate CoA-transferase
VVAVVETDLPDRDTAFSPPDDTSRRIAGHILEFFQFETARPPAHPIWRRQRRQRGHAGQGLNEGPFEHLTAYTEVLQDGMLEVMKSGKMEFASATAISLSSKGLAEFRDNLHEYRKRLILRPQEISNHPEVIRRLGVIAANAAIEFDIYGNV